MVFKNKQKRIIAGLMIGASILTALPWILFGLLFLTILLKIHFPSEATIRLPKTIVRLLNVIYYCGWWWWLVAFGLDVAAVVLVIRWRHQALKVIGILLLIIIPIASFFLACFLRHTETSTVLRSSKYERN